MEDRKEGLVRAKACIPVLWALDIFRSNGALSPLSGEVRMCSVLGFRSLDTSFPLRSILSQINNDLEEELSQVRVVRLVVFNKYF